MTFVGKVIRIRHVSTIALAALLGLSGCSALKDRDPVPTQAAAVTSVEMPDVVGQPAGDARSVLMAAPYEFDVEIIALDGSTVIVKNNWTIISTDPEVGTSLVPGAHVSLIVDKPEDEEATNSGTESVAEPTETMGQQNAKRAAQDYLKFMAFSRTGLIEQLQYEQYSIEDATYGVDALGVDWNAQAAKSAQSYNDMMPFSHGDLVDQLIYEGFTPEQAEFGVSSIGL